MELQCPLCRQPLQQHLQSGGWYCEGKHRFERVPPGYWNFYAGNKPSNAESRQVLRARQFLVESGTFRPVIVAMAELLIKHGCPASADCVHLGAGHAWLGKSLLAALEAQGRALFLHCPLESENEAYAAVKAGLEGVYLTSLKTLPFADNAAQMLWLLEAPLKGKEWLRVLNVDGYLLMLLPGPRHLWQLKQFVYPGLQEKPFSLELPKSLALVDMQSISWSLDVSPAEVQVLLEMAPWAWRAKASQRQQIAQSDLRSLEMDYRIVLAKKLP